MISCVGCQRTPEQIPIYVMLAVEDGVEPDVWVSYNDGTYNTETGRFACDECYIDMGQPGLEEGWTA